MMSHPLHLRYFSQAETDREDKDGNPVNWFSHMSPAWWYRLDILRYRWTVFHGKNAPIHLSPHPNALGRQLGVERKPGVNINSDHNIDMWEEVRGGDVMPAFLDHVNEPMFKQLAIECGFTAIGFYPHWRIGDDPRPGFHLGERPDRKYGDPATWGAVWVGRRQLYVSYEYAVDQFVV